MDLLTGWVIHFILFQKCDVADSVATYSDTARETQYRNEEKGYPGAAGTQKGTGVGRAATPIDVALFSF